MNADLHLHSRYSAATSRMMNAEGLAQGARRKGVQIIGSGDALHRMWLEEVTSGEEVAEGTYLHGETRMILTCEVEDLNRVHHLLIFPSRSTAEEFRETVADRSSNLDSDGRPTLHMTGDEIAEVAIDLGALIGPCHAFTPWTSMYAYHQSMRECYRDLTDRISFLELGLSADTDYADRIAELQNVTFLTNSDAHSPAPLRLAREFNRFEVQDATAEEIMKAIEMTGGRRPILNVGLPPQEGKYNESACIRCYRHYTLKEAVELGWRCPCGGKIKKGVRDRVEELATWEEPHHPDHRPPYLHLIPLAQIIATVLKVATPTARSVMSRWESLVEAFGDEVTVLVDTPVEDIADVVERKIALGIQAFREGRVIYHPGGGGMYGSVEIPLAQATLMDF